MEDYIISVLEQGKFSDEERVLVANVILEAIREGELSVETFTHIHLVSILRFLAAEREVLAWSPVEPVPEEPKGGMGGSVSQE